MQNFPRISQISFRVLKMCGNNHAKNLKTQKMSAEENLLIHNVNKIGLLNYITICKNAKKEALKLISDSDSKNNRFEAENLEYHLGNYEKIG